MNPSSEITERCVKASLVLQNVQLSETMKGTEILQQNIHIALRLALGSNSVIDVTFTESHELLVQISATNINCADLCSAARRAILTLLHEHDVTFSPNISSDSHTE